MELKTRLDFATCIAAVSEPRPAWKPFRRGSSDMNELAGWLQSLFSREQLQAMASEISGCPVAEMVGVTNSF